MLGSYDIVQLSKNAGIAGASGLAVGSTDVAYSASFPIPDSGFMGWFVKFASAGTISVKVELEQGNVRPTTEGAADAGFVVPDTSTSPVFANVEDSNLHGAHYAPMVSKFARLKLTGLGSNDASTVLSAAELEIRRT